MLPGAIWSMIRAYDSDPMVLEVRGEAAELLVEGCHVS